MRWSRLASARCGRIRCRHSRRFRTCPRPARVPVFRSTDLSQGHTKGARQRLPLYQESGFFAPQRYRGQGQVEASFVAGDHGMHVMHAVPMWCQRWAGGWAVP
ncbi:sporulation protein [Streptomyces sp. x-80]|uniref:sporulation protein n=1 Tax=Streptomyces sp. x-80 TaxID=2789282 RepID=UPI00397F6E99